MATKPMTVEQIAARRATRLNNKLRREAPLLADVLATTPEAEQARLERQYVLADAHAETIRARSRELWAVGMARREQARLVLSAERWAAREQFWARTYGHLGADTGGAELADLWWAELRGTNWAFANCPNAHRHNDPRWWEPHWHYLANNWVETTQCPTCGIPQERESQ